MLDLGQGRPEAALGQLGTVTEAPSYHYGSALRSVPDLVEAAVRVGRPERAAEPVARFTAWVRRADTPATLALAERCRALLAPAEDAERHYLTALELHELSFEQARTQLLYGAWLRRVRRKTEALAHLRAALDHLQRISAAPWVRLARVELDAAGATTREASRTDLTPLTPQELQIARLAAQGCRIATSPPTCSSATGPSPTTSTRSTRSSASHHARSSTQTPSGPNPRCSFRYDVGG